MIIFSVFRHLQFWVKKQAIAILKREKFNATLLTSTCLRKQLATITQYLKQIRRFRAVTFMGHTCKTHSVFYRLPDKGFSKELLNYPRTLNAVSDNVPTFYKCMAYARSPHLQHFKTSYNLDNSIKGAIVYFLNNKWTRRNL